MEIVELIAEIEAESAAAASRSAAVPAKLKRLVQLQTRAASVRAALAAIEEEYKAARMSASSLLAAEEARVRAALDSISTLPDAARVPLERKIAAVMAAIQAERETALRTVEEQWKPRIEKAARAAADSEKEIEEIRSDPFVQALLAQEAEERERTARLEEKLQERNNVLLGWLEKIEQGIRIGYLLQEPDRTRELVRQIRAASSSDRVRARCREVLRQLEQRLERAKRKQAFVSFARWCNQRAREDTNLVLKLGGENAAVCLQATPSPDGGITFNIVGRCGPGSDNLTIEKLPGRAMAWHTKSPAVDVEAGGDLRFWRGFADGRQTSEPVSSLEEALALLRRPQEGQVACGLQMHQQDGQWAEWTHKGFNLAQWAVLWRARDPEKGTGSSWHAIQRGVRAALRFAAAQAAWAGLSCQAPLEGGALESPVVSAAGKPDEVKEELQGHGITTLDLHTAVLDVAAVSSAPAARAERWRCPITVIGAPWEAAAQRYLGKAARDLGIDYIQIDARDSEVVVTAEGPGREYLFGVPKGSCPRVLRAILAHLVV